MNHEEIGNRRAKLVRPKEGTEGYVGVYFENFGSSYVDSTSQNRLHIIGMGLTPSQQETAFAIFRTIRPQASDPQPTR